jgi:guanyl-specific ribonuclease Sa
MKFKTFRNIAIVVAVLVVGGVVWGASALQSAQEAERQRIALADEKRRLEAEGIEIRKRAEQEVALRRAAVAAEQQREQREQQRLHDPAGFYGSAPGLRPVDRDVLALVKLPAQEKIKDGTKGKPYKVNLYADDKLRFNRAKVDLDRDEKADESWTFKPDGSIERKVAPADDEKYTQTLRLDATSGWIDLAAHEAAQAAAQKAAQQAASTTSSTPAAAGSRPVDQDMQALLKSAVQEKIKDGTKGKPYKINLYSDDGARFNRAKVDLDRDDKWDESWTFKPDGSTERQVSPADDEKYTELWTLEGGTWRKK